MNEEKIYYTVALKNGGEVKVTNSRLVFRACPTDQNFVLRNIAAIRSQKMPNAILAKIFGGIIAFFGLMMVFFGTRLGGGFIGVGLILVICGILCFFIKDTWAVVVDAGGTPKNGFMTKDENEATSVVEEVNNALLDLDKYNRNPGDSNSDVDNKTSSSIDEIKKMKELLDAGALTQEEFDAKKKELLNQ